MAVKLRGLTLKGKNRVREHGDEWILSNPWKVTPPNGAQMLMKAVKTGYLKWGPAPDFEVVE